MSFDHEPNETVALWKLKNQIKTLESAKGNGTSMISLIIPPNDQIHRARKMLLNEYQTASNIKSRVNRQSVQTAITSTLETLKRYTVVPPTGLALYSGTILTEDGKEKHEVVVIEPFRPINASLYLCDNKFHTEALSQLLESEDKFGFIVVDGKVTLFGTLTGQSRVILHKFTVELPKKHGRGGQSASRFERLRVETRHNYLRKVSELARQFYVNPQTSRPSVSGLVLAGSGDLKTELSQSNMFDPRLREKVLKVVDVSYGGEIGFDAAIKLSSEVLGSLKFIKERSLIERFLHEIGRVSGKYVYGVDDTLGVLESGAVETLIVWVDLEVTRYVVKDSSTGEIVVKHLSKEEEADRGCFRNVEVMEKLSLVEWFANEYRRFGCTLEFVSDKSEEGSMFCKGFGGIGGILRYPVDLYKFDDDDDDDDVEDDGNDGEVYDGVLSDENSD